MHHEVTGVVGISPAPPASAKNQCRSASGRVAISARKFLSVVSQSNYIKSAPARGRQAGELIESRPALVTSMLEINEEHFGEEPVMMWLVGVSSFAYGAVVGGIAYYFIARMKRHDPQALKTVLTLIGGAAVLAFLQRVGTQNSDYQDVATATYPIGLLFGWGLPVLLKWDRDERASERERERERARPSD